MGVGCGPPPFSLYPAHTSLKGETVHHTLHLWALRTRLSVRVRQQSTEGGASLVEYALLVSLIAIVCFVAVMYFGDQTGETFSRVGDSVRAT